MKEIKTVGVKAFKDNLSSYLRDVKAGDLVLITDRGTVIAELKEPDLIPPLCKENSLMNDWIRAGWLLPATKARITYSETGIKCPDGTAENLINQDRGA